MSTMVSQIIGVSIVSQTFVQAQIKENIKALCHWPLWGNSPVTSEFPLQRASNAGRSIWWRHHVGSGRWRPADEEPQQMILIVMPYTIVCYIRWRYIVSLNTYCTLRGPTTPRQWLPDKQGRRLSTWWRKCLAHLVNKCHGRVINYIYTPVVIYDSVVMTIGWCNMSMYDYIQTVISHHYVNNICFDVHDLFVRN